MGGKPGTARGTTRDILVSNWVARPTPNYLAEVMPAVVDRRAHIFERHTRCRSGAPLLQERDNR
eukprot:2707673-Prorocentrum_lima.AAC.1